jgi:hypothetical protein
MTKPRLSGRGVRNPRPDEGRNGTPDFNLLLPQAEHERADSPASLSSSSFSGVSSVPSETTAFVAKHSPGPRDSRDPDVAEAIVSSGASSGAKQSCAAALTDGC